MRGILFFLLLSAGFWWTACQSDATPARYTELLTAHPWEFDVDAMRDSVDLNSLDPQTRNMITGSLLRLQGATLTFQPDSLVTVKMFTGDSTLGGWAISADGKGMLLQMTKSGAAFQSIVEMSPERIVLGRDDELGFLFPKVLVPVGTASKPQSPPSQQ